MDKVWMLREKAKAKLMHESRRERISPHIRAVWEAEDWVCSLRVCLEQIAKRFDMLADLSNQLTEALDRDAFVERFRKEISDFLTITYELSYEYAIIMNKQFIPMTLQAKKRVERELGSFWIALDVSLRNAQTTIRALSGRAEMMGVWSREDLRLLKPVVERILSTNIEGVRGRLNNGELILGDDIDVDELLSQ